MTALPMPTPSPAGVNSTEPDQRGGANTQASGTHTHTPEPWQALPGRPHTMHHIQTADGEHIATFSKRGDMERVVAAINACAGMPNDMQPGCVTKLCVAAADAIEVLAERRKRIDELTEALRKIADCDVRKGSYAYVVEAYQEIARAAIAKVDS